jgi:hypothetical protein
MFNILFYVYIYVYLLFANVTIFRDLFHCDMTAKSWNSLIRKVLHQAMAGKHVFMAAKTCSFDNRHAASNISSIVASISITVEACFGCHGNVFAGCCLAMDDLPC